MSVLFSFIKDFLVLPARTIGGKHNLELPLCVSFLLLLPNRFVSCANFYEWPWVCFYCLSDSCQYNVNHGHSKLNLLVFLSYANTHWVMFDNKNVWKASFVRGLFWWVPNTDATIFFYNLCRKSSSPQQVWVFLLEFLNVWSTKVRQF